MPTPGEAYPDPCATCATPTLIYSADGERLVCTNDEHPAGGNRADEQGA